MKALQTLSKSSRIQRWPNSPKNVARRSWILNWIMMRWRSSWWLRKGHATMYNLREDLTIPEKNISDQS